MSIGAVKLAGAAATCTFLLFSVAGATAPALAAPPQRAKAAATAPKSPPTAYSSVKSPNATPEPQLAAEAPAEAGTTCPKARKKLWVEGEGWVVRRVAICF